MTEREFLVTGASGFVGGEVVRQLLARGVKPRVLLRNPAKGQEFVRAGATIARGDLTDADSLLAATRDVRGIYHVAALYREANLPVKAFYDVNVEGTRRLFDAAIASGVERLIHCSTGGVLGDIKAGPGNELTPYSPDDDYQVSKMEGEKLALEYFRGGKIRGVVIRPGMVYGPRDTRFLKLFKAIAKRRFLHIGPGTQWVHYVDVRDLAGAFLLAMDHGETNGEIYTIAGATPVSFNEMVGLIARALGVPEPRLRLPLYPLQLLGSTVEFICKPFGISPPIYRRRVDFFAKNRIFDISKAQRELHYVPRQSLEDEVREVCAWYRTHGYL